MASQNSAQSFSPPLLSPSLAPGFRRPNRNDGVGLNGYNPAASYIQVPKNTCGETLAHDFHVLRNHCEKCITEEEATHDYEDLRDPREVVEESKDEKSIPLERVVRYLASN